jgi:penicillin-insensitive murein endopeptidase
MKLFRKRNFLVISIPVFLLLAYPEYTHVNEGTSESIGSVRNGQLKNGYILPYKGPNFSYFSPLSYYVMNNGYTHSTLYKVVMEAYEECERTCPDIDFKIMQSTDKHGGKLFFHRTHQNGYGIDFMIPTINKKGEQSKMLDWLGMWHYLLNFDEEGYNEIIGSVQLDFETISKHIIAIDDAARRNGLRIRKILIKTQLIDELYATDAGKEIQRRGIFIPTRLPHIVNQVHDDHYHIDFEER